MGPKNSTATCASTPSPRDLSWIDRMYMKFETMCVEVDKNPSLLIQETSKYVENQVNAVGANVKKLCTELIQDLIATPMLSPEGIDKKLECALHCKCHCMDLEKTKLISTDAASIVNGDGTFDNTVYQKQDMMEEEGSQVEMPKIVEKGVSKVENIDVARELQNPKTLEVCGPDFNNIQGKDGTNKEQKLTTAIRQLETEHIRGHKSCEEVVDLAKGFKSSVVQQGIVEDDYQSSVTGENKSTSEVSVRGIMKTAASRSEAVFAEHTSRSMTNHSEELVSANVSNATNINGCTNTFLGSQKDTLQPQMLQSLQEMRARNAEGLCKRPMSDTDFQNILIEERGLHLNTHSGQAKSTSITEDLQAEQMKGSIRADGSFQSMCTYDFQDDEPITMSEFLINEDVHDDEEQSAHWFVGEDLRKALQPDIFSVEKSRYGESFVNEFDLDWELL